MVEDTPDGHFFSALQAFKSRTCYANSSGESTYVLDDTCIPLMLCHVPCIGPCLQSGDATALNTDSLQTEFSWQVFDVTSS